MNDIILGAHFYACGGGGALENGLALLEEIKQYFDSDSEVHVQYINITEVNDNDQLPVLAAMGAPQQFLKKGYNRSPVSAFNTLQSLTTKTFSALSPVETGPIAYGMSLLAAAANNIPILNGDGGGRAFPCLQLSTFANVDLDEPISAAPCILTSEKSRQEDGGIITIDCQSSVDIDAITRGIISTSKSFDQRASLAAFAMTGQQLKQPNACVPDMLLQSKVLGQKIREYVSDNLSCFNAIETLNGSQCMMKGRLNNIYSATNNGFDWVTLEFIDEISNQTFYVIAQNENMILWSEKLSTPMAMAPDLICCISEDATLMSNDEILNAWNKDTQDDRLKNMAIFTLPAASQINQPWFHEQFSNIFKRFGYFGCYRPLQVMNDGDHHAK